MGLFAGCSSAASPRLLATQTAQSLVRAHSRQARRRGGVQRTAAALRRREDAGDDAVSAGQPRLPLGVAGDHSGRGTGQCAGAIHGLHRLRVDLEHRRQQPAPQRDLPRRRCEGQPGRALHHARAARQRRPARSLEVDGRLRGEDRRRAARHRAQRQRLRNGRMFPIIEPVSGGKLDKNYAQTRTKWERALRGHPDQGRRRDASVPVAQRRVRGLQTAGTRPTSMARFARQQEMLEFEYARSASRTASSSRRSWA